MKYILKNTLRHNGVLHEAGTDAEPTYVEMSEDEAAALPPGTVELEEAPKKGKKGAAKDSKDESIDDSKGSSKDAKGLSKDESEPKGAFAAQLTPEEQAALDETERLAGLSKGHRGQDADKDAKGNDAGKK